MMSFTSVDVPPLSEVLFGAALALFWSYGCLSFAAYLKTNLGLRTAYTRKVFHVLIFLSAVIVQAFWGLAVLCVFGTMVTIVVGHAVLRLPGQPAPADWQRTCAQVDRLAQQLAGAFLKQALGLVGMSPPAG